MICLFPRIRQAFSGHLLMEQTQLLQNDSTICCSTCRYLYFRSSMNCWETKNWWYSPQRWKVWCSCWGSYPLTFVRFKCCRSSVRAPLNSSCSVYCLPQAGQTRQYPLRINSKSCATLLILVATVSTLTSDSNGYNALVKSHKMNPPIGCRHLNTHTIQV